MIVGRSPGDISSAVCGDISTGDHVLHFRLLAGKFRWMRHLYKKEILSVTLKEELQSQTWKTHFLPGTSTKARSFTTAVNPGRPKDKTRERGRNLLRGSSV